MALEKSAVLTQKIRYQYPSQYGAWVGPRCEQIAEEVLSRAPKFDKYGDPIRYEIKIYPATSDVAPR